MNQFELLLAVGIGLILLLVSVPSWHSITARNQTAHTVNQMVAELHTARNEAAARNGEVVFCGSSDHLHCDGQWNRGQLLLLSETQQILRAYPGMAKQERFWWQGSLGYNDAIKWSSTGFTQGQRGSFYYCPSYKPERYGAKIIVSDSGRVRVETSGSELQQICT